MTSKTPEASSLLRNHLIPLLPGLGLAAVAVAISMAVSMAVPILSALLVAILLGVLVRNLVKLPAGVEPGLAFSAKRLLRAGIVLLGLQLAVGDILGLGAGMIAVVVAVVTIGLLGTTLIGRLLGISRSQTLLVACGFSICGAAAVAAAESVVDTEDDEEVVTAIALVVLFGTLMIPLLPLAAALLGLAPDVTGLWAGASIHEVAQVVAVGGSISAGALAAAVIVKLARVLLLAPVMTVISFQERRRAESSGTGGKLPPIVPLFVAGFIGMVALRSFGIVPEVVLDIAKPIQTALLAAAMFALGTGVKFSMFRRVGLQPFLLATLSTLLIATVGLVGTVTLG